MGLSASTFENERVGFSAFTFYWVFTFSTLFVLGMVGINSPTYAQETAETLTVVEPEQVGLSSERLQHLSGEINHNIENELLAGSVVLIARDGEIAYLDASGMQNREVGVAMNENTIFRIASMTKPITSVAVMMLYEEGHFQLGDPVSDYISAFKDMRVLADSSNEDATGNPPTVPANNPITIRHLLTHTSGLLAYGGNPVIEKMSREKGITSGLTTDSNTLAEDIPKLATLPLEHHPGEDWTYGMSVDVLGYLVEVVSGMTLDRFFKKRIFEPLGMSNTQFHVSSQQESRLAATYTVAEDGGLQRLGSDKGQASLPNVGPGTYPTDDEHRFLAGGAGLTSTVPDYYRFTQMLLNGGELDGVRLLSPKSIELMITDHVGDRLEDMGFGLGFSVTRSLSERGELGSVGTFGWGSFWYGTFFIDPAENMIGISVAQKHPAGGATLNEKFGILARQAIVE
ncbi:serine hydrolase domain-containing protein [Aliifodinibius sp. S!AR15-10]|uniref:serine hydrolase domain-containing protein n=1 Tax=Aliifodinibius sp. S!AR15-10 TaxID=2950437 RepID=UPI00286FD464|nr:serine hydrolase domain-containing protein [Aliifodinibius sp. S!AR15-10]